MAGIEIEIEKCPKCGLETLEVGMNYHDWIGWGECSNCGYEYELEYADDYDEPKITINNEG